MSAWLTFRQDGTGYGLYTEAIDLMELGELTVRRASHIEFDNARQLWVVRDPSGKLLYSAQRRLECLEWEQRHFDVVTGMDPVCAGAPPAEETAQPAGTKGVRQ